MWGEPAVEAEQFPSLARGFVSRIPVSERFRSTLSHMDQLRIDGELSGYTGRTDYGRLARTFLMAVFVGIIIAGVYLAITPVSPG